MKELKEEPCGGIAEKLVNVQPKSLYHLCTNFVPNGTDCGNEMDLAFFRMLSGNMGTGNHSQEEILNLKSEYLNDYTTEFLYPEGEKAWPMLRVDWTTLTEDYEEGLSLVLEMLGSTDFTDTRRIQELLEKYGDTCDISRSSDKLSSARDLAAAYVYRNYGYRSAYRGQGFRKNRFSAPWAWTACGHGFSKIRRYQNEDHQSGGKYPRRQGLPV